MSGAGGEGGEGGKRGEGGEGTGGQAAGAGGSASTERFSLSFEEIELDRGPKLVTHFAFLPSSYEFLATTQRGRVLHYVLEGDSSRLLGAFDIAEVYADNDCGLVSVTPDPEFEETGFIYLGYCDSFTHSGIFRYQFDPTDYDEIPNTKVEVLRVGDDSAVKAVHGIGRMNFDRDGNLWTSFGEHGLGFPARDPTTPLGAVLRLRPRQDGGYDAPNPPNPTFPGSSEVPLVYAFGLRSPWTGSLDASGRYWVADVGHVGDNSFEEINLVTQPGLDFGWDLRQGPCQENCSGQTDPIRSWKRRPIGELELEDPELEARTSRVGWVGVEYRETDRDRYDGRMHGKVLYGDMCLGFLRGIEVDQNSNVVFDQHLGHLSGASAWQIGPDGYIYASIYARCTNGLNSGPPDSKLVRAHLELGPP